MKISGIITEKGQELKKHGSGLFPCAAYESRGTAMGFPWHWHEEFELSVVEEGSVEFYIGQECYLPGGRGRDLDQFGSAPQRSVSGPGRKQKKRCCFFRKAGIRKF